VSDPVNVFVSYSWGVERDTGIVDELEALCPARNIRLIRDKNTLQHGDLIEQFMNELTGGEHVITVFSKPYFQSRWCMYELLKTWQKGDFQPRTHPIIADDCDLQDAEYRIGVVKHWIAEHQKIWRLLDGQDPSPYVEEIKKANLLRDISQNASELMNFAAGRLTTPLADLRAQNYAQLLDNIALLIVECPHLPRRADSEFLNYIRTKIAEELSATDVTVFTDVLRTELNQVLEDLDEAGRKVQEHKPKLIAEPLVWVLANGKEQVPVINKVLLNTFHQCFDRRGSQYALAQPHHEAIKEAIGQLLGWLVLASLDENQIAALAPAAGYGRGIYFELPVKTQCRSPDITILTICNNNK
jgi:hypothetical protein